MGILKEQFEGFTNEGLLEYYSELCHEYSAILSGISHGGEHSNLEITRMTKRVTGKEILKRMAAWTREKEQEKQALQEDLTNHLKGLSNLQEISNDFQSE